MSTDWSDPFILEARLARLRVRYAADRIEPESDSRPVPIVSVPDIALGTRCLIAGVSATLLFVWPVLFLVHIFFHGPSDHVYWAILAASALVGTLVFAVLAKAEDRYWAEHWQDAGDHADPPYWR